MENRRDFLKKSLLTLGAAGLGTSLANAIDFSTGAKATLSINQGDVILFQGDSITDAGRNKENLNPNDGNAFGNGYAFMAASTLLNKYADKDIKVYNRGISGNRVPDLINRWQKDALDLKPNILSIMIGVNDFWRTMDSGAKNSPEQYKAQYKELLDKTKAALPDVKLIIIEPFGVKNVKHVTDAWFPEFPKYLNAAKEIAQEYGAIFLPYQSIFDQGLKRNSNGGYWTTDGVHTTMAGANLMAESWLKLIK
ncbi:SGNH/GDSL hydrolase family protein [Sphingobacterium sp.]|uniref:SGNH/GDSL hydrolase family protein n=1 Tax=Sphingobacterium sp. TaxID=341027 RepID=UPI0028AF4F05|nr:SGNH/GDSL hydrolase family protein [Sphingobacterium sp.]